MSLKTSVDEELVYLDAKRIVMPIKGVKPMLKLLHVSHVGVNKTHDMARCTIGRVCSMTLSN